MNDLRQTVHLDLRYSEWASRILLAACSELPLADRSRDLALSHGSVLGTLHHVFVSERFWAECLLANKIPPLDTFGGSPVPGSFAWRSWSRSGRRCGAASSSGWNRLRMRNSRSRSFAASQQIPNFLTYAGRWCGIA